MLLFIFINFFLLTLNKKLIILKYNQKVINLEIFKKIDFIEDKLKALEKKTLTIKEKIFNYHNNIYYFLSTKEVLGYKKIRIGQKSDGGYILLNDLKNIKIGYIIIDSIFGKF